MVLCWALIKQARPYDGSLQVLNTTGPVVVVYSSEEVYTYDLVHTLKLEVNISSIITAMDLTIDLLNKGIDNVTESLDKLKPPITVNMPNSDRRDVHVSSEIVQQMASNVGRIQLQLAAVLMQTKSLKAEFLNFLSTEFDDRVWKVDDRMPRYHNDGAVDMLLDDLARIQINYASI